MPARKKCRFRRRGLFINGIPKLSQNFSFGKAALKFAALSNLQVAALKA
jgi:hypothetical protein